MSTDTDALVRKLRYMGRQYAAGQVSRGGSPRKHYLEEAADTIERLTRERDEAVARERERVEAMTRRMRDIEEAADTIERLTHERDEAVARERERVEAMTRRMRDIEARYMAMLKAVADVVAMQPRTVVLVGDAPIRTTKATT